MKSNRRQILIGSSAAIIARQVAADNYMTTARSYFLMGDDFEFNQLKVPPPPLDDVYEANLVLELQKNRSSEVVENIIRQDKGIINEFLSEAKVSNGEFKYMEKILSLALSDAGDIIRHFKKIFNRNRPNTVNPKIQPIIVVPRDGAYPSGHATQAAICAHIISDLTGVSEKEMLLLANGIGLNREIAGLHYPSDTHSGLSLGGQISKIILTNLKRSKA